MSAAFLWVNPFGASGNGLLWTGFEHKETDEKEERRKRTANVR